MKMTNFLLVFFLLITTTIFAQPGFSSKLDSLFESEQYSTEEEVQVSHNTRLENMGLVSELTYIKLKAEKRLSESFSEYSQKPMPLSYAEDLVNSYSNLRIEIEQLINQLSIDGSSKNKVRIYRKLDNAVKEHGLSGSSSNRKVDTYLKALSVINKSFESFMNLEPPIVHMAFKADEAAASITAIAAFIGSLKGGADTVRENDLKKISAVTEMLKTLKLTVPKDLLSSEKVEAKEKDGKKKAT